MKIVWGRSKYTRLKNLTMFFFIDKGPIDEENSI